MSLVNYSSSDDDEIVETIANVISLTRTPLPNMIRDLNFGELKSPDYVENAEEHNGKVRSFAHERGNWATYIYINCARTDTIRTLQNDIINSVCNSSTAELKPFSSLHISLTRTLVLKHHWIHLFVAAIQRSLANVKRFSIHMNDLDAYRNDEGTRTFVGLKVAMEQCVHLQLIVNQLDSCLREFRLPDYYREASFHASILWCLGDHKDTLLEAKDTLSQLLDQAMADDDATSFEVVVSKIECKIGNKLYAFPLS